MYNSHRIIYLGKDYKIRY